MTVKADGLLIEEGAVKVAAMKKKRFGIYDYLSRTEIEMDFARLSQIFPAPVVDKIKEKLGQ